MLTLKTLKSPKGAHKNVKRLGRGQGSGRGTQAGKGGKGQTARKSGGVKTGFEGGQMPLYRRLPKRGFLNSFFKDVFAEVNLARLEGIPSGEISRSILIEKGILKGKLKTLPLKILGRGDVKNSYTFVGIKKFTKSARDKILKAGGKISEQGKE